MIRKKICGIVFVAGIFCGGVALAGEVSALEHESVTAEQTDALDHSLVAINTAGTGKAPGVGEDLALATEESSAQDVFENEYENEDAVDTVSIADPIEPVNRVFFQFNDKVYHWVLKPVAVGYDATFSELVRVSVKNFFSNVKMPIRFVNSLLQGKFAGAGTELARFGINTTIGFVGFFDVAKFKFDLEPSDEDFGQTLGFYGLGGGMYIVWPFLGPSTLRDTVGMAGDAFLSPVSYISPFEVPFSLRLTETVNNTSLDIDAYDDLIAASVEPYTGVKDAYIQYRKNQIAK